MVLSYQRYGTTYPSLEDGTESESRNVGKKYHFTLCKIPNEHLYNLHPGGSPKSCKLFKHPSHRFSNTTQKNTTQRCKEIHRKNKHLF